MALANMGYNILNSKWGPKVRDFILENKESMCNDDLVTALNKKFKLNANKSLLRGFMSRYSIKRKNAVFPDNCYIYTAEAKRFITENKDSLSNSQLADELRRRFGIETNNIKIKCFMVHNGIRREKILYSKGKIKTARPRNRVSTNSELERLYDRVVDLELKATKTEDSEKFEKINEEIDRLNKQIEKIEGENV